MQSRRRLGGAFRDMDPVLALTILNPKLSFSQSEMESIKADAIVVTRPDGSQMDVHDLKRLQVCLWRSDRF